MIKKYALYKAFSIIRFNTVSVRSLAKDAKIGLATSKRCLDYLYQKKILKRQTYGRLYQYTLDTIEVEDGPDDDEDPDTRNVLVINPYIVICRD